MDSPVGSTCPADPFHATYPDKPTHTPYTAANINAAADRSAPGSHHTPYAFKKLSINSL